MSRNFLRDRKVADALIEYLAKYKCSASNSGSAQTNGLVFHVVKMTQLLILNGQKF